MVFLSQFKRFLIFKMSITRFFLTLLFSPLAIFAATELPPIWTQFPGSPSSGTSRHDDICFVNETNGWTARGRGGIFKTTDGGQTWVQKLNKTDTHFRSIAFASPLRGWAGNLGPGSYDTMVTETNVLFETFDGGETWVNRPGFREQGMLGLCSLQVFDSQTIYGVGRVRGPAYFIKSTDGGTNWSLLNLTTNGAVGGSGGVMGALMDVYFKDKTNGFIVGMSTNTFDETCVTNYYGRIARTTNGGVSWFPVATTTIPCCYFWKMSWPGPNVAYASLQQNGTMTNHIFYKTIDGGATWISNGVPFTAIGSPSFYWQGVGFITTNEGWAGGSSYSTPYTSNFLHTVDGGATWTKEGYNDSRSINRIRFYPKIAVACGGKLHTYKSPLAITNHPQDQIVLGGNNAQFEVGAAALSAAKYQWQKNGTNISNATNTTFSVTNVTRLDEGSYSVVVTNSYGAVTSSNVFLRVYVPQQLSGLHPSTNGSWQFFFGDWSGGALTSNQLLNFELDSSSNLIDWQPLNLPFLLTNGKIQIDDGTNLPQRFYRVMER